MDLEWILARYFLSDMQLMTSRASRVQCKASIALPSVFFLAGIHYRWIFRSTLIYSGGSEALGWPHRRIISGRGPEQLGNRSKILSLLPLMVSFPGGILGMWRTGSRNVKHEAFFILDEAFCLRRVKFCDMRKFLNLLEIYSFLFMYVGVQINHWTVRNPCSPRFIDIFMA